MEDTLRDCIQFSASHFGTKVLILVLMEDTLREGSLRALDKGACVLILVLMEDTLRASALDNTVKSSCLNPCSNGRYSQSRVLHNYHLCLQVLILVLMEDTLRGLILLSIIDRSKS